MVGNRKAFWVRMAIGLVMFAGAMLVPKEVELLRRAAFAVTYLIFGADVLWSAFRNIFRLQMLDEKFLMSVASCGAFVMGEYAEAVMVMCLYQIGEYFQSYAVDKSRRSVAALMDVAPESARIWRDEQWVSVDPEEVPVGSLLQIRPGERVPIDGMVVEGESALDTAALTGEPAPRDVRAGDDIVSGSVNLNGMLTVRTTKVYADSTVARILDMVENAVEQKAKSENFITHFARYYTPVVVVAAVLIAVIPSLFDGAWGVWVHRALTFLVVSCPCALVISVPLAFFSGIGAASARGILIKGSNYLQVLADVDTVVMDKTGTLTTGVFAVVSAQPYGVEQDVLRMYAAAAEQVSNHPIAQAIVHAYEGELPLVSQATEDAGYGVCAVVDRRRVAVGNRKLMVREQVKLPELSLDGTVVYVAMDGRYIGCLQVADTLKNTAEKAVRGLQAMGTHCVMLSGDRGAEVARVAQSLGVEESFGDLLPDGKMRHLEQILAHKKGMVAFVGDGINDAPVLARADVGIAMGAFGSDAAVEAADVVLMDDDPAKLEEAVHLAKKTMRIVKGNIVFALGIKIGVLILGALGITGMWQAIFADVGVSMLAILNSMRLLYRKKM